MKIFDATAIIAFLSEMNCPDSMEVLSKHYDLIVPEGVAAEIRKEPGKGHLRNLSRRGIVKIVQVDQSLVKKIQNEHPQLHNGECEAIAFVESYSGPKKICIVSDDYMAKKIFQKLNFKWTERLLDIMKEKGLIDPSRYDEKMAKLAESPFYSRSNNT
ncbi:MAG: hypothetical protein QXI71_04440 [Candidatus Bathyarchaeia archaeon]